MSNPLNFHTAQGVTNVGDKIIGILKEAGVPIKPTDIGHIVDVLHEARRASKDMDRHKLMVHFPAILDPIRDDVRRFVDAMVFKLNKNAHKGRWSDLDLKASFERLTDEVKELHDAIYKGGNTMEIVLEAADVANFALILSNIATEKGK